MANVFVNKKVDLTSNDSATTLYTVPSATTAIVKSILVSDDSGSGSSITITLTNTSDAVFSIVHQKQIPANDVVQILTQPLVMEESEILKVQAADANELFVIASILEIQPREVTT